jgi:hypothetical protein
MAVQFSYFYYPIDVYVRYKYEEDASKAVENLNDRFYGGFILFLQ